MNFFKPKFWDKNKVSFFSILFFPISLIVKLSGFIKSYIIITKKSSIPVICVGNIYLGGTGKTPVTIEVFSILKKLNMNPAFIRKKYKSFTDETILQKKYGPIYQSKKRVSAIEEAANNKIDVAILDDGFQDFSIYKDFSIICFNEKQWIGNGFIIPSGPLRESLSSLSRADCVFINGNRNINIEKKIYSQKKEIKIFYIKYKVQNAQEFINKNVTVFAGIGNPINFFDLVKDSNINIIKKFEFPDHYKYPKSVLENLIKKAKENNTFLLTTEKDYARIDENYRKYIKYLKIEVVIEKKNEFIEELKKII